MNEREQVSHPEIHGSVRWLDPNPAELLRAGNVARLEVVTPSGKRVRKQEYWVQAVTRDGAVVAYRMSYFGDEMDTVYTITIGSDGSLFQCDCRDATYRARVGGCRHLRSLAGALKKIGLLA